MNNTWELPPKAYGLVAVQKSKQVIIKLCGTDDDWESKCANEHMWDT